jgi:hypothetical protein
MYTQTHVPDCINRYFLTRKPEVCFRNQICLVWHEIHGGQGFWFQTFETITILLSGNRKIIVRLEACLPQSMYKYSVCICNEA